MTKFNWDKYRSEHLLKCCGCGDTMEYEERLGHKCMEQELLPRTPIGERSVMVKSFVYVKRERKE